MEFNIKNTQVYGLENAIIKSGNPMRTLFTSKENPTEKDLKRAKVLGNAKPNSGHDCYLKGTIVQFDITAPLYFWKQAQRYTWFDFISSQSTMHCIMNFDIKKQCNGYVYTETLERLEKEIKEYNSQETKDKELWYSVISNIPSGFNLGATITTNYLQLKTMYHQRKGHKLVKEWGYFCEWCEELPMFKELCLAK